MLLASYCVVPMPKPRIFISLKGPKQVYFAHDSMPFSNSTFADKTCWCDGGPREEPNWPSWLEASQLCTTFLQLPLLWDGIGTRFAL